MHVACTEMKSVLTGAPVFCVFSLLFSLCDAWLQLNTYTEALIMKTTWVPSVVRKSCLLLPDEGPCRANVPMYYYKPAEKKCDTFKWGGCMGNGNRFNSEAECNTTCLSQPTSKQKAPRWCQLTFDYGFCFGEIQRYYYDSFWRVCKPALYSGCGGNRNNFYHFEQCERVCRFGQDPLTTTKKSGGKRKVVIINPPTTNKHNVTKEPAILAQAGLPGKPG